MWKRTACSLIVVWTFLMTSDVGWAQDAEPVDTCPAGKKAAVLVYFVGLMVFERKPNFYANPTEVYAYLPQAPGHNIVVQFGKQSASGHHSIWQPIRLSGNQARTLSLDLKHELIDARPSDLATACEVSGGSHSGFNTNYSRLTFKAQQGIFETCALVRDENDHLCQVKYGDSPYRKMAETMILEIPLDDCPDQIKLLDDSIANPIPIRLNPGAVYKTYNHLFEIAIVNVPDESRRDLSSMHTQYLKELFDETRPWPGAQAGACTPTPAVSDCFKHFAAFVPRYSGFNRPICPLIEGP